MDDNRVYVGSVIVDNLMPDADAINIETPGNVYVSVGRTEDGTVRIHVQDDNEGVSRAFILGKLDNWDPHEDL